MSTPTMLELWTDHWDRLDSEDAKLHFLKELKRKSKEGDEDARETLLTLVSRWVEE